MTSDDLLDHFKLRAEVFSEHTVHWWYKSNRRHGIREKIEKKWDRAGSLGEGGFGQVWKEQSTSSNDVLELRAVKVVKKQRMRKYQIDFKKEVLPLAKFSKEEYKQEDVLVTFYGWFETDQAVHLAMEYFRLGDLSLHLKDVVLEDHVRQISSNLLQGLKIMHNEGFAHRDLKPANIFVADKPPDSPRWWVKIGDFGISKRVRNEDTAYRTQVGSPLFQAPEIHGFIACDNDEDEYDNSVDIWSLGCVIYTISAQCVPFSSKTEMNKFCQKRIKISTEPLSRVLSSSGIDFVQRLLTPEPEQRISVDTASKEPWLTSSVDHTIYGQTTQCATANDIDLHELLSEDAGAISYTSSELVNEEPPRHQGMLNEAVSNQDQVRWKRLRSFQYPQSSRQVMLLQAVCFHPDNSYIATGDGAHLRFWDLSSDEESYSYYANDAIQSIAFCPKGNLVAFNSGRIINVWNATTKGRVAKLVGHIASPSTIVFSPDGRLLASKSEKRAKVWDIDTGRCLNDWITTINMMCDIMFTHDSKSLLALFNDMSVTLSDIATGSTQTIRAADRINLSGSLTILSADQLLARASGQTIQVWGMDKEQVLHLLPDVKGPARTLTFSTDSELIASTSDDGNVQIWRARMGVEVSSFPTDVKRCVKIVFSCDSQMLALVSLDGSVTVFVRDN